MYKGCYTPAMKSLEKRLLQLTLFLIPTNLAYHWYQPQAYVNGKLIDYLLPRLYLTDVLIITLLILWLWRSRKSVFSQLSTLLPLQQKYLLIFVLFLYLLFTSLTSSLPLPAIWFWLKAVELVLFFKYLMDTYPLKNFLSLALLPLVASFIAELLLAIYQYINQSSLFGYILFGEPLLRPGSSIATGIFPGGLHLLAYGTTPHPNVLAGFFTVISLIILLSFKYNPKIHYHYYHYFIIIVSTLLVTYLTQSLTSFLGYVGGLFLLSKHHFVVSRQGMKVLLMAYIVSNIIIVMLIAIFAKHSIALSDSSSLTIRYKLNNTAISLFLSHPYTGVGLNHFIPAMITANLISTAPFLQPAHNLMLLWLTEVGLIGISLSVIISLQALRAVKTGRLLPFLSPLLVLLFIGIFDHYPLTLQTGQLLMVFSFYLAIQKSLLPSTHKS